MMCLRSKDRLTAALFSIVLLAFPACRASAQQISYYTFDAPGANPSQYSYTCNTSSTPAPLFCLNNNTSSNPAIPYFAEDANIPDPNFSGGQWVLQTTNAGGQAASMWFSVPQFVDQGFNAWFQFRITPIAGTPNTADGFAFVIQNSQGGNQSVSIPNPNPSTGSPTVCSETGVGSTVVGSGGGCMGYGGIDNSVALEFDTFYDWWDPQDAGGSFNDNHIALQSCGIDNSNPYAPVGLPNSPVHYSNYGDTSCLVTLGTTSTLISNPSASGTPNGAVSPAVTLADGNLHQVLIVYNGPEDSPANMLSVYLDPAFNPGTLTPVAGSQPLFTGPFDITQYIGLFGDEGSAGGNFPAYVGFTAATGYGFENHEITGWTFTPHTQVQQTQPLNTSPTTPTTTTFSFGTHSYSVIYPAITVPTGTTMTVIATPVPQSVFSFLVTGTPFAGAQCQEYDDTGVSGGTNNCIAYNISCTDGSGNSVACPAPSGAPSDCAANPASPNCITLTTAYNNSLQPTTPGFLQGDPFYAPVNSVNINDPSGIGTTGFIQCSGECAVTLNQTVNLVNPNGSGPLTIMAQLTVTGVDAPNQFEFTSSVPLASSYYNGAIFLTSTAVQNIIIPGGYTENPSDGSTTGTTPHFSDFIATSVTPAFIPTQTGLAATNYPATENQSDLLTATIAVPSASLSLIPATGAGSQAGGSVTFYSGSTPPLTAICSGVSLTPTSTPGAYTATCSFDPGSPPSIPLSAVYSGDPYYEASSGPLTLTINPNTYLLDVTAATGGTISVNSGTPGTNFQSQEPAQSQQSIAAIPNTGYYFSGWTGSSDIASSNSASTTVTMKGAENIMAGFTAKTTPTINWTPASIELGYPLTGAQLNASATPAGGTYQYTPPAGTIIGSPASGQTLSVTYTPTDLTHYSIATKTVPLTVTPGPLVSLSPGTAINFGTVYFGSIITKTVTVSNTGNAALSISDPFIAIVQGGNSDEFVTLNLCPKSLAAGKSCVMTVTFIAGPFYTPQTAMLKITDNAYGSPQIVNLTALVINPVPQFSSTSLSFGTVNNPKTSAKSITLTSAGGTPLSLTAIGVTGAGFSQTNTCTVPSPPNQGMSPKSSCTITVTFAPSKTAKGLQAGTLVITDNAFIGKQIIPLSGTAN